MRRRLSHGEKARVVRLQLRGGDRLFTRGRRRRLDFRFRHDGLRLRYDDNSRRRRRSVRAIHAQHRVRAFAGWCVDGRHRARALHIAKARGFRAVLAGAQGVSRQREACRDHDPSGPVRSAHEDRDRSDRTAERRMSMKLPRRTFLRLAAAAAALPAASRIARPQAYPSRPVRFVVGFAPGGGGDLATRLMAQWLSERLGQQFVVENRVGAASNLATEQVVRSPADGYTLIQLNVANAINVSLYHNLSFDVLRDLAPVASFMRVPNLMEVSPSLPVNTVPEFIAYAKANPGKVMFASSGVGTTLHMSGELFRAMAGVDILHVPYRGLGAGGYTDLMTGVVHVTFDNLPASIELVRAGKLRGLAVTSTERSQAIPELPVVADFLPGYEASAWYGIAAPAGTPRTIVETLNRELNAAFVDPRMKARIAELGGTPLPGSPADFAKFFADETEKWAKVVKLSGAKAD